MNRWDGKFQIQDVSGGSGNEPVSVRAVASANDITTDTAGRIAEIEMRFKLDPGQASGVNLQRGAYIDAGGSLTSS